MPSAAAPRPRHRAVRRRGDRREPRAAAGRVVPCPEPGLALLDGGRHDLSFDFGLPEPQLTAPGLGAPTRPVSGEITELADQHAFLRLDPADPLAVGDVVRLGVSHPCTVLDKWQWIPITHGVGDDPGRDRAVRTWSAVHRH